MSSLPNEYPPQLGHQRLNLGNFCHCSLPVLVVMSPLFMLTLPWLWGPWFQAVVPQPPLGPGILWPSKISIATCCWLPLCNPWLNGHSQLYSSVTRRLKNARSPIGAMQRPFTVLYVLSNRARTEWSVGLKSDWDPATAVEVLIKWSERCFRQWPIF